jgi:hypothetical protein
VCGTISDFTRNDPLSHTHRLHKRGHVGETGMYPLARPRGPDDHTFPKIRLPFSQWVCALPRARVRLSCQKCHRHQPSITMINIKDPQGKKKNQSEAL